MIKNFSGMDGLILASILSSGRNVNLSRLITAIDYIDRSTPPREEINLSLSALESCGYITIADGKIKSTKLAKKTARGCFTVFCSVIDAQIKFRESFSKMTYDDENVSAREFYSQAEYDEVCGEYGAGTDREINRLMHDERHAKTAHRADMKMQNKRADSEGEFIYVREKRILNYTSTALEYLSEQGERVSAAFSDCANKFKSARGGSGQCVGDRDFTKLYFILYTSGKRTKLQFKNKKAFYNFQKALRIGDFTTFDLT